MMRTRMSISSLMRLQCFLQESKDQGELTIPYNPQIKMNSKWGCRQKNRSIVDVVKSMIRDQNLHMYLWAEASRTVVYVQNKSPHKILWNKTPKEVFAGKKPEVRHLRIFGCPMYIHFPKKKRTKLEPSRKKGTSIGYNETSKAYRICIFEQRKIEIRRDAPLMKKQLSGNLENLTWTRTERSKRLPRIQG